MVGTNNGDTSIGSSLAQGIAIGCRLDGRVALDTGA
jgi:hypothetical protein